MVIFLYGPDTYRSRQKLSEIIEHYKKIHQSGLNLKYFNGQKLDFQDFKNKTETISMFREKKLIVLENVFSNRNFKEEFLKQKEKFLKVEFLNSSFKINISVPEKQLSEEAQRYLKFKYSWPKKFY